MRKIDPDKVLDRMREAIKDPTVVGDDLEDAFYTMFELFADLDEWLSEGGRCPDDWSPWMSKKHPGRPLSPEQVRANERMFPHG